MQNLQLSRNYKKEDTLNVLDTKAVKLSKFVKAREKLKEKSFIRDNAV